MDALGIARYGMMAAQRRFNEAAHNIARAPADESVDVVHEIVDLTQAKHHFAANTKVIQAADEMWRSLLEIQVR